MTCDQARREMCVTPPETMTGWTGGRVRRHLARCAACAEAWEEMQMLERRTLAWRASEPPRLLEGRIAAAVAAEEPLRHGQAPPARGGEHAARPSRARFDWSLGLTAAALAVVLLLNGVLHLRRIVPAGQAAVRSAHIIVYYQPHDNWHGPLPKMEELWYQDGAWRRDYGHGARIVKDGTFYEYDPGQHRVMSARESPHPTQDFGTPDFSPPTIASYYLPGSVPKKMRILSGTYLNGRSVDQVIISIPTERMTFWLDLHGLPLQADKEDTDDPRKPASCKRVAFLKFEFNKRLPAALFDPDGLRP